MISMKYISCKNLCHAYCLSKLSSKIAEMFKDTVLGASRAENVFEKFLCNVIHELTIGLSDLKLK